MLSLSSGDQQETALSSLTQSCSTSGWWRGACLGAGGPWTSYSLQENIYSSAAWANQEEIKLAFPPQGHSRSQSYSEAKGEA